MKKLLLLFFICFPACSENYSFIEGQLPNASYDNEWIYLVPFEGASKKTVDSTLIRKAGFRFKLKPEKQNQIYILRVRPVLRLELQEILVVSEPGTVHVSLDLRSSASGTPLNETLQEWKEKKHSSDSILYSLRRKYREVSNETGKALLLSQIEELDKEYRTYSDSLAEMNKDNPVGQLIGSLFRDK